MSLYASIDLHSNNCYAAVTDEKDNVIKATRLPNNMDAIDQFLMPYKESLPGVAVESTFNGYWLEDGLSDRGYKVRLVHTTACEQYSGLKYKDDKSDCLWLNRMQRLNVLPEGYVYPREPRSVRDLFRKRMQLVSMRTKCILSLKQQLLSWECTTLGKDQVYRLTQEDIHKMTENAFLKAQLSTYLDLCRVLDQKIKAMEELIQKQLGQNPTVTRLRALKGVGPILSWTIYLETGDIARFSHFKKYLSYSGLVESKWTSNQKKKGKGNVKNRNKYLRWAFGELAVLCLQIPEVRRYHDRLLKKKGTLKAKAILASKFARVIFMMMKDPAFIYDQNKLFGNCS